MYCNFFSLRKVKVRMKQGIYQIMKSCAEFTLLCVTWIMSHFTVYAHSKPIAQNVIYETWIHNSCFRCVKNNTYCGSALAALVSGIITIINSIIVTRKKEVFTKRDASRSVSEMSNMYKLQSVDAVRYHNSIFEAMPATNIMKNDIKPNTVIICRLYVHYVDISIHPCSSKNALSG